MTYIVVVLVVAAVVVVLAVVAAAAGIVSGAVVVSVAATSMVARMDLNVLFIMNTSMCGHKLGVNQPTQLTSLCFLSIL